MHNFRESNSLFTCDSCNSQEPKNIFFPVFHEVSYRLTGILQSIKTLLKYCFEHCHAVNENTSFALLFSSFFFFFRQLKAQGLIKYLTSYWVGLQCLQKASFQQGHLCPVPGRKGDLESSNTKNVQQPFSWRAQSPAWGAHAQLWSVSARADALWVCQLIGVQQRTDEVGAVSVPQGPLFPISPTNAVPLLIRHGGQSESMVGVRAYRELPTE